MARKKEYIEDVVVEKAMHLFWKRGFETTSMQMLEKEMGINKFSIYSSFGSKNGIFLESLKCYRKKLNTLLKKLEVTNDLEGIKKYFYEFIVFTKDTDFGKGCLITNTANEIDEDADESIKKFLENFTSYVRTVFFNVLKKDKNIKEVVLDEKADFLLIAMFGLSSATRVFNEKQLEHYIENIFKNL